MVKAENEVEIGLYQQNNVRIPEEPDNETEPYSLAAFKKKLRMSVVKCTDHDLEFDIIGINPAIANAIRRILLAEDLTNRIGLVPIKVDPRLFEYRDPEQPATAQDTVVFNLNIRCTKNLQASQNTTLPKEIYRDSEVYSSRLTWLPLEDQEILFAKNPPRPIHDDILIAKLRPGQEIDMKIEYLKGIGKTHAKFSPVATASYRLLPTIEILEEIRGEAAVRFKESFSKGVVEIERQNGEDVAKIVNPRMDTCSRNVLMYDDLASKVKLGRRMDHFIFSVESVGALPPDVLVKESIKVMLGKCKSFLDQIESVRSRGKHSDRR